jgi:hypothetical protein
MNDENKLPDNGRAILDALSTGGDWEAPDEDNFYARKRPAMTTEPLSARLERLAKNALNARDLYEQGARGAGQIIDLIPTIIAALKEAGK